MEVIVQPRTYKKINNNSYTVLQVDHENDRWMRSLNVISFNTVEKLNAEERRCTDFIKIKKVAPKEWNLMYERKRKKYF
jgi:hypothetical protein